MINFFAETSQFTSAVLLDENVKDVAVYERENEVLIAYLSKNVFTKSEGENLYKRVLTLAQIYFDKDIFLCRDADVFYMLKAGTENSAERAKMLIKQRS